MRDRLATAGTRNVLLLAAASLVADVSGEMLMAVFPFLLLAQGATGLGLGLVGGATDALGHFVKAWAGRLADARRRLPLVRGGYLLAALSRIGVALAPAWGWSLAFRGADRVGKGLRTAPRDALLAESAGPGWRLRAFGIHRAADTTGAFVGVLVALVAVQGLDASPQSVVLAGAFVGLLTLVPLLGVREAPDGGLAGAPRDGRPAAPAPGFAPFVAAAALAALGQASYLFYMVRAHQALGSVAGVIALYLLFNLVYAAASYPAALVAGRTGVPRMLVAGYVLFASAAALHLALPWHAGVAVVVGFATLGLGFALVDGNARAHAAALAGGSALATRLGIYHAATGLATLVGGVAAGLLWDRVGPAAAFAPGVVLPLAGALALLAATRRAPVPAP